MPWPNDTTTIPASMSGTTLLADSTNDHSLMHREIGTLLNALPTTLGSTPGTNLLRQVVNASDYLFVANSGGTAATTITKGTFNNSSFGTPNIINGTIGTAQITGGSAANITLGTPTITLSSDAQGDLYYRSAGGTVTRLGIGSNGQVVTTNGTTPSWGGFGTYVYTESVAQGTFANANANIGTVQIVFVKNSIVSINATCDLRDATGESITLHLLDGSGTLTTNGVNTGVGFNSGERMTSAITYAGTLAAGTHTINYQAINGSGTSIVTVGNVQMAIFGIPG